MIPFEREYPPRSFDPNRAFVDRRRVRPADRTVLARDGDPRIDCQYSTTNAIKWTVTKQHLASTGQRLGTLKIEETDSVTRWNICTQVCGAVERQTVLNSHVCKFSRPHDQITVDRHPVESVGIIRLPGRYRHHHGCHRRCDRVQQRTFQQVQRFGLNRAGSDFESAKAVDLDDRSAIERRHLRVDPEFDGVRRERIADDDVIADARQHVARPVERVVPVEIVAARIPRHERRRQAILEDFDLR